MADPVLTDRDSVPDDRDRGDVSPGDWEPASDDDVGPAVKGAHRSGGET